MSDLKPHRFLAKPGGYWRLCDVPGCGHTQAHPIHRPQQHNTEEQQCPPA